MSKDMLSLIKARRSIRRYKAKMPEEKIIKKVLEAGRWAPSGLNNQPWRFMVIKKSSIKDRLANFTNYGKIVKEAPLAIAVFLDKENSYHYEKDI
ncbi:MAG: nitroreductase family protein, partial [Candidatus Omnitrophica bacterium]|nr:nitroreductase family protein [Candidatus Omnitrophota bacterium]